MGVEDNNKSEEGLFEDLSERKGEAVKAFLETDNMGALDRAVLLASAALDVPNSTENQKD